MKFNLALGVLASVLAVGAQATPITQFDWGEHMAVETAVVNPIGKRDYLFLFSLSQATHLVSTAASNNQHRAFDLKGGTVSLFSSRAGEPDELLALFDFDGSTGELVHDLGILASGRYHFLVSGARLGGPNGGAYTLRSMWLDELHPLALSAPSGLSVAAANSVPEPKSSMLMLAGLAGLAVLAALHGSPLAARGAWPTPARKR